MLTFELICISDLGQVRNINFPPRRFFGNKNESFVMLRKDMLEVSYFIQLHGSDGTCVYWELGNDH